MVVRAVVGAADGLVRDVLRGVLPQRGIEVAGEAAAGADLVALCRAEAPDVAVCASVLADGDVEGFIADVVRAGVRVLVLAEDGPPERVTTLMGAGADGYLLHDSSPEAVAEAVVMVAGGSVAVHPTVAHLILHQWRRLRSDHHRSSRSSLPRRVLTRRETDVLGALADGLTTKGVAQTLGMATKTVENHKIHIFDKLGVRTQSQAVAIAITHGLLAPRPLPADASPVHSGPEEDEGTVSTAG